MGKTILVADDSKTIRRVVEMTFENTEFSVVQVADGEEAFSKIPVARPHLILADVAMPGSDGYALCAALKSDTRTESIPVVLLASAFDPFDEHRARLAGADGHIKKPFDSQSLINLVKDLTGGKVTSEPPMSFAATLEKRRADADADLSEPDNGTPAPSPFAAPRSEHTPRAPTPAPQPAWTASSAAASDLSIEEPELIEDVEIIEDAGDPTQDFPMEIPTGPTLEPPSGPGGRSLESQTVDVWALADAGAEDDDGVIEEIAIEDIPIEVTPPMSAYDAQRVHDAPTRDLRTRPELVESAANTMADLAAPPLADATMSLVPGLSREELIQVARQVIEEIAWEVVPDLAEAIIREELARLLKDR